MKLKCKNTSGSNQEHALLSPSSAKKWLNCPAALACEFGLPNEYGQAAVNGTVMHFLAETVLNSVIRGEIATADEYKGAYVLNEGKGPIKALAKANQGAKGVVKITDDFVSQVNKYVDYCRPIIDAAKMVEVESRVNLTRVLHPGVELNGEPLQTFGTADLVAVMPNRIGGYLEPTYTLIVGDLKTGRHKVLAKENKQLMLYALGLLRKLKRLYDITAVRLVIFQPYAGGADEWDTTPEALELFGKFAGKAALRAIDAFERGKKGLKPADFRPGNDACRWCRFAEKCNAKRKVAFIEAQSDLSDGATEMTLDQLKAEWDKLPLLRQHIADIEKAMYAALMRGAQVEGLKLVEGRPGNRSWSDTKAVEEFIINRGGGLDDYMYKRSLISPTEAEKELAEDFFDVWDQLKEHITRKPGQPSIATADDKRSTWVPVSDTDLED